MMRHIFQKSLFSSQIMYKLVLSLPGSTKFVEFYENNKVSRGSKLFCNNNSALRDRHVPLAHWARLLLLHIDKLRAAYVCVIINLCQVNTLRRFSKLLIVNIAWEIPQPRMKRLGTCRSFE
jgi:hypothetical protein